MNKMEFMDNSIFDNNINDVENTNLSIGITYEESDENLQNDNPTLLFSKINFISNFVSLPFFNFPQLNDNHTQFFVNPPNTPKTKKLFGRKRKNSGEIGAHDKYAENNQVRKFKIIIKNALLELINSKIKNELDITMIYKNRKFFVDGLLRIGQEQMINTNVIYNRQLLCKTLKDIFSDEIAKNYGKYPKNYNKILIKKLYESKIGKNIIAPILDMKFLDCIRYFRKDIQYISDERYSCLRGLETKFENLPNDLIKKGYDDRYIKLLLNLIYNFEYIYYEKKSRNRKTIKIG